MKKNRELQFTFDAKLNYCFPFIEAFFITKIKNNEIKPFFPNFPVITSTANRSVKCSIHFMAKIEMQ